MSYTNPRWPLRHISIRVPWHDDHWSGTVCSDPHLNESCLRLTRISSHRGNSRHTNQCEPVSGLSIKDLEHENWPCCVAERGMFMAPFEYTKVATHPYAKFNSKSHGHFAPTPLRYPSYSAAALPFRWMFREGMENRTEQYGIDVDPSREPDLGFSTTWIQDHLNQKALLECFFGHLKPQQSLCFFYAKETPFVEDTRRVIVGVGRVVHIGQAVEYRYNSQPTGNDLRSILWEHMVQHSIKPGFKDGFLLPYHELMPHFDKDLSLDPVSFTAFAPEQYFDEFSYASEHVSHDAAIEALLACEAVLVRSKSLLGSQWDRQIKWVHDRISEMWKMRGPCPGLGAALCAFGIEYGTFVAREIETKVAENEDPWPVVARAFSNPAGTLSQRGCRHLSKDICRKWEMLPAERRNLLKLLSRFNLQPEQAKMLYVKEERERADIICHDAELIGNPYLIYEITRLKENPVSLRLVDRGVFPESMVRDRHPLPSPSAIDGGLDSRRVRAFVVQQLEQAAAEGHTLQRKADIVKAIRDLDIRPACPVDEDQLAVAAPLLKGVINSSQLKDGTDCYQLLRMADIGQVIRSSIEKRRKGRNHTITADWRALLDKTLNQPIDKMPVEDREQEERARTEKAAALKVLAESRISVLVGPAGTGKTTLLSVLCGQPEISRGDILLLAPTGKARVRMEQTAKESNLKVKGYTIAQFLNSCGRYDGNTGRYHLSNQPKVSPAKTVIIDECSMLTEEMLAAVLDALQGVERLILVGDPRQLPPIGTGRPFVDLVSSFAPVGVHNLFPCVGPCYAELNVLRRQAGAKREDVGLARWFSGVPVPPGEDEFLDKVLYHDGSKNIEFKEWNTPDELRKRLLDTIVEELKLEGIDDAAGFEMALGGKKSNTYVYFNKGAAKSAENWQILSPVRKKPHGVAAINRLIHDSFRTRTLDFARSDRRWRKIPEPMGPEQIVYGDKVINIRNHRRNRVFPSDNAIAYLANGEIGIAVGQFKTRNMKGAPWLLKVEFSSQPGFQYDFGAKDFGEEATPCLELAYALTVHKAQGSEFGTVILILPNPCRLLSRELLYTALTRQQKRLVILHQGKRSEIRAFSSGSYSEVAKRLTNLLVEPVPIKHSGVFYEQNLIHRTLNGEMVRSKSELLIADRLHTHGIDYVYEQPLTLGGHTKFPDFTVDDSESGLKYYWEHCGMLNDPFYKKRWEEKRNWYKENGILPIETGGGRNGTLIITRDNELGGISTQEIESCIKKILNP